MSITRRSFLSLFATLALAFSMFGIAPSAFADGEATSGTIAATGTAAVEIGDTLDMSDGQFNYQANGTCHIDYKITNTETDTGAATINKHSGVLTPSAAGTVTVTAYLTPGSKQQQVQGNPCTTALASATKQVTITEPEELEYGYQGNALQVLMTSFNPDIDDYDEDADVYYNTLSEVAANNGVYSFNYSQNYGIGQNSLSQYITNNQGMITLYNETDSTSVASLGNGLTLAQQGNSKQNLTVQYGGSLTVGKTYTLTFLPNYIAGNGTSRLNATVRFTFTI